MGDAPSDSGPPAAPAQAQPGAQVDPRLLEILVCPVT